MILYMWRNVAETQDKSQYKLRMFWFCEKLAPAVVLMWKSDKIIFFVVISLAQCSFNVVKMHM